MPTQSEWRAASRTDSQTNRAKGTALRKVDCHGTRCRLSVDFDDDSADRRVVGNIFELLADASVDTQKLGFTESRPAPSAPTARSTPSSTSIA